jgi:hypothetical protein
VSGLLQEIICRTGAEPSNGSGLVLTSLLWGKTSRHIDVNGFKERRCDGNQNAAVRSLATEWFTFGCGRVQREGGAVEEIRPGDVLWFAPGKKHWHGAAPTTAMTHIAVQEQLDGKAVDWMEHVSGRQYRA